MAGGLSLACKYAQDRHRDMRRWRNLWTLLLFVFGATIVGFLSFSILLFIREAWLPGAITTVGTIASGAGIAWVVARRNEAVNEENVAYKDVKEACFGGSAAQAQEYLGGFEQRNRFWRPDPAPGPPAGDPKGE